MEPGEDEFTCRLANPNAAVLSTIFDFDFYTLCAKFQFWVSERNFEFNNFRNYFEFNLVGSSNVLTLNFDFNVLINFWLIYA